MRLFRDLHQAPRIRSNTLWCAARSFFAVTLAVRAAGLPLELCLRYEADKRLMTVELRKSTACMLLSTVPYCISMTIGLQQCLYVVLVPPGWGLLYHISYIIYHESTIPYTVIPYTVIPYTTLLETTAEKFGSYVQLLWYSTVVV